MVFIAPKFFASIPSKISKNLHKLIQNLRTIWRNQSELTLLEMAIVLIVVGVFLAGVVPKGRQMLEQARLRKTSMEIHQYIMALSEFLEKNSDSIQNQENADTIWTKLQSNGGLPYGQTLYRYENIECPKLSNGGFLLVRFKDSRLSLILGKKGRSHEKYGFMGIEQARSLKKGLEIRGVAVVSDNEEVVSDTGNPTKDDQTKESQLYAIQIPIE